MLHLKLAQFFIKTHGRARLQTPTKTGIGDKAISLKKIGESLMSGMLPLNGSSHQRSRRNAEGFVGGSRALPWSARLCI